ncbi:MAG: 4-hydroxyphenylpyruvate dioxygenase [Cyanobacteria bacterium CRU_2_1]|nr:4-hydroxyphenylpyruvate dioxygenase [Cyanobacteria bacterium RU_5_0]NJR58727.1 4-hydroxyphenylpyruvate dioxygenase [Cyanobacteria bacterium CRU_2_1]
MTVQASERTQIQEKNALHLEEIDYVEFYVGNARQAAHFFCTAFGFTSVAYAGLETGWRDRSSYVLKQSNICFVVTSALTPDSPVAEFVKLHGDGVYDIALRVDDVHATFKSAVMRGAKPILEPVTIAGEAGCLVKATIASYSNDLVHSFVHRHHNTEFSPEYVPLSSQFSTPIPELIEIDHIVINVELGKMDGWAKFYSSVMDFYAFQEFTSRDISTLNTALSSKVLQNKTGQVRFAVNEPVIGSGRSQVQEYLDFYQGSGVQHIALRTNSIVKVVQQWRINGVEFLYTPDAYYDGLRQRIGEMNEDWDAIRDLNILVDRDHEGYLLQIFTKPLTDRPTVFLEIIQRNGSKGFGNGNFKALFEAIEREQANRGTLYSIPED